jgi:hypothetical protein
MKMKLVNWIELISMSMAILFAAPINQSPAADMIRHPASAVQTAYEYDNNFDADRPWVVKDNLTVTEVQDDRQAPTAAPSPTAPEGAAEGYNTEEITPPGPAKPWQLPQPCFLQQHGIVLGGWIDQGFTGNPHSPVDRFNGGAFHTNDRANEYQLNQAWFFLNKPIDNQGEGWDIGGRVDIDYSTDWRCGNTFGLENRFNGDYQLYGLIMPQFYLDMAYNDLTVRLGHWAPMAGYEVVPSPANFFYSHEYGMCNQPILVTGGEAIYKINDQWSVLAGANRGWFMFEDMNHSWDIMSAVEWVSKDKKTNVKFNIDSGPQDPAGVQDRLVYTLVGSQKLGEKYVYALEHNWGREIDGSPYGGNAYWYGITQYLFYTINPKWQTGLRAEWFRDNNGGRIAGLGNVPGVRGALDGPGFIGDFGEISVGLNWRPHPNWVLRPEVRYDWYNGSRDVRNHLPFNDGMSSDQLTYAADLILTF